MTKVILVIVLLLGVHASHAEESIGMKCICSSDEVTTTTVVPTQVSVDGHVRVYFPRTTLGHPRNFLIRAPSGATYFIVDDQLEGTRISSEEFFGCEAFEIALDILHGVVFTDRGLATIQQVFTESGEYELYFADNLETESTNTFSISRRLTVSADNQDNDDRNYQDTHNNLPVLSE